MSESKTRSSQVDLAAIREKLAGSSGPQYWRSLNELAESPEFRRFVEDEFPSRAEELQNPATRRDVLRLMAASLALAGATGCTKQPTERIVPYVRQPEAVIPGNPLFFATAMPFRGGAIGVLVESHEGRPTKIEGNPEHPASLGRTLPFQQASILDLYDPGRSQAVQYQGRISTWGQFLGAIANVRQQMGSGEGCHVLTEPLQSPTLMWQRQQLQSAYPALRWHEYDPVSTGTATQAASLSTGTPVYADYDFGRADVVVSLDADFLFTMPGSIPHARAFISRRHAEADRQRMNRLYVLEPTPTVTGSKADHRIPIKASAIAAFATALAGRTGAAPAATQAAPDTPDISRLAEIISRDLIAHRGASLVLAGESQPHSVHRLVHAINQALGNIGSTVTYTSLGQQAAAARVDSLKPLVDEMRGSRVRTLLVMGSNPVYTAPADFGFRDLFQRVPLRIHLGMQRDETGMLSHWHIPEAHYLETWSDSVAFDGTESIIQPLIQPLYDSRSAHEVVGALTGAPDTQAYGLVKSYWRLRYAGSDFDQAWERWVHDGIVRDAGTATRPAGTAQPPAAVSQQIPSEPPLTTGGLEIVFKPDPCVWDGRFANNAWLQELPKPHSKLTWDNAAYISPRTAERLRLRSGQTVELRYAGRAVSAPVWVTPGQAEDSIAVFLGYGRQQPDGPGKGAGYNAYALRTAAHPYFDNGLEVRPTGNTVALATTQDHFSMEGREIVRAAENNEFLNDRNLFHREIDKEQAAFSLYPEWNYTGYRWGMTIDLNACIGCNACVVACVAENNVSMVGKEEVLRGREMHWLRIDHYHAGNIDEPDSVFQPVLCMHCEKAPCEPVCPVAATLHSADGLSQMIYNRCIGTRYCSNNCPYKVRRFNFLLYSNWATQSLVPLRNPDVTVRSRGVMEKCSFCIQRIQAAKIESEREDRPIRDGDVVTACQSACPTDAIVFGDLNDRSSRVFRLSQTPLNYSLLAELGTQPRVTYQALLRNRNPELERKA